MPDGPAEPGRPTVPDGPAEPDFTAVLAGFAAALREAGLSVGTGDLLTYCAAMAPLASTLRRLAADKVTLTESLT